MSDRKSRTNRTYVLILFLLILLVLPDNYRQNLKHTTKTKIIRNKIDMFCNAELRIYLNLVN